MRFVPFCSLQAIDVRERQTGKNVAHSHVNQSSHETYGLAKEFANLLDLEVTDLLTPQSFDVDTHSWVRMHNRIRRGRGSDADEARQVQLLRTAKLLVGKLHQLDGGKPRTIGYLVFVVLTQVFAMEMKPLDKIEVKQSCSATIARQRPMGVRYRSKTGRHRKSCRDCVRICCCRI